MIKKLLFTISLLPSLSYAESISLNKLFEVSKNNFCYQQNSENYKDIEAFLKIKSDSNLTLMSKPVVAKIAQSVLEVNETEEHLKSQLIKYDKNKFPKRDLDKVTLKNIYTLEFSSDIEIGLKPVETITLINRSFPGLKLDTNNFGGQYTLVEGIKSDFNKASNIKEFSNILDKVGSSSIAFVIRPNGNSSIISYKCQIVTLSSQTPESVAKQLTTN